MPQIDPIGGDDIAKHAHAARALEKRLNNLSRDEARDERDKLELKRRDLASEYHDRLGEGSKPSEDDHKWGNEARAKLDGLDKDIRDIDAALSLQGAIKARDPKTANQKRAMLAYASPGSIALVEAEKDGSVMTADEIEEASEGAVAAVRVYPVNGGSVIVHGRVDEDTLAQVPGGGAVRVADVTSDTASIGNLLPTGAASTILERLVQYGDLGMLPSRMSTPNGNPIIMPAVDDTAQEGRRIGKTGRAQTPTDPNFAEIEMGAHIYTSDPVQVRQDSITDAPFGMGMLMEHLMAVRIARVEGKELTTGTGSDQPQGVITVASEMVLPNGRTPSAVSEFEATDLSNLIQEIDPAYIKAGQMSAFTPNMGMIGFMLAHGSVKVLRNMKDSENRPLWLPNIREKEPPTIYGYGYHVNTAMDDPAAGKKAVVFGHFGYYMVRRVEGVVVRRWDDSQYGKDYRVAFQAFSRCDARCIGGWAGSTTTSTKAFVAMKQAAN